MQDRHIAPAEIQALAAHRVAVVGALPQQDGGTPMQPTGQSQGHRERPGLVEEAIDAHKHV